MILKKILLLFIVCLSNLLLAQENEITEFIIYIREDKTCFKKVDEELYTIKGRKEIHNTAIFKLNGDFFITKEYSQRKVKTKFDKNSTSISKKKERKKKKYFSKKITKKDVLRFYKTLNENPSNLYNDFQTHRQPNDINSGIYIAFIINGNDTIRYLKFFTNLESILRNQFWIKDEKVANEIRNFLIENLPKKMVGIRRLKNQKL